MPQHSQFVRYGPHGRLTAHLRECWVLAENFRVYYFNPADADKPTIHAIVIEEVRVEYAHRRKGYCREFVKEVEADPRFELTVVEGVQNPWLAAALTRWGWECDPGVMDYYKRKVPAQ